MVTGLVKLPFEFESCAVKMLPAPNGWFTLNGTGIDAPEQMRPPIVSTVTYRADGGSTINVHVFVKLQFPSTSFALT
jgi:hypothetical protein